MTVRSFTVSGSLCVDDAAAALQAARAAIDAGCHQVNLRELDRVDSSAVATLLAIRRHALEKGADVTFSPLPPALAGLVRLYEVGPLLGIGGE